MQITYSSTECVTLVWHSGSLLIGNPPPKLLKELTYTHRSLEQEGWGKRKTVKTKVQAYLPLEDKPNWVVTYQGFLQRCRQFLEQIGRAHV